MIFHSCLFMYGWPCPAHARHGCTAKGIDTDNDRSDAIRRVRPFYEDGGRIYEENGSSFTMPMSPCHVKVMYFNEDHSRRCTDWPYLYMWYKDKNQSCHQDAEKEDLAYSHTIDWFRSGVHVQKDVPIKR